MQLMTLLILFLLSFALVIFVLLFGQSPRFRHGIVGRAHVFIADKMPFIVGRAIKRVLGARTADRLERVMIYCCETRNPWLQVFFVALTSISIVVFLKTGLPHVPGIYLHAIHRYVLIPLHIVVLYVSYYVVCTADPGTITHKNVQRYLDKYPYDGILFAPKTCSTCHFQKPARSKHCSMCNACIGRHDHHCGWINRCVGENNLRYFLWFLMILTEFCTYGAYLCVQIYRGMIIETGLDRAVVRHRDTGKTTPITFWQAFLYILQRDRTIGAIGILASVCALVVFIFCAYQLYLVGRGMTTNEAFKWECVEELISRGEFYVSDVVNETGEGSSTSHDGKRKTVKKRTKQTTKATERNSKRQPVRSLDDIDNLYDDGFWRNLSSVFFQS